MPPPCAPCMPRLAVPLPGRFANARAQQWRSAAVRLTQESATVERATVVAVAERGRKVAERLSHPYFPSRASQPSTLGASQPSALGPSLPSALGASLWRVHGIPVPRRPSPTDLNEKVRQRSDLTSKARGYGVESPLRDTLKREIAEALGVCKARRLIPVDIPASSIRTCPSRHSYSVLVLGSPRLTSSPFHLHIGIYSNMSDGRAPRFIYIRERV